LLFYLLKFFFSFTLTITLPNDVYIVELCTLLKALIHSDQLAVFNFFNVLGFRFDCFGIIAIDLLR
jgi:hypothetical protein